MEATLRRRGFVNATTADAPICRWRIGAVSVDVMPTLAEILGFTNRWYPHALATAQRMHLPSKTIIRLVTAPVFIATKFEAFDGRGKREYLFSHDLGDIISVIDGRDEIVDECRDADNELRIYLRDRVSGLMAILAFREALPGHLPGDSASRQRLPDLEEKLRLIAALE